MRAAKLAPGLVALAALAGSAGARTYPYELAVTPIEGPVDRSVQGRYTAALVRCQARARTTNDNALCFKDEFGRQDAALNAAWARALAGVPADNRAALRAAQRQWVKARDPFCDAVMKEFAGGTMAGLEWWSCRAEVSIRRTMWLESVAIAGAGQRKAVPGG
jgi:uncharacterized protein YecT (DUF1311 family)